MNIVIREKLDHEVECKERLRLLLKTAESLDGKKDKSGLISKIKTLITFSESREHQPPPKLKRFPPKADHDDPTDDYKKLPLFPDTDELFSAEPVFLRANRTRGQYRDSSHYLDVHTRLMREDYLEPIRDGLKRYKRSQINTKDCVNSGDNETASIQGCAFENDLRFYYNVRLAKIVDDSLEGVAHVVVFDAKKFKEVDWENSKRFTNGALLVFSKNTFKTVIFATVTNRDSDELKRGHLQVVFQSGQEEIFTSAESDRFIIAETTALFESHRHVVEGLQETEDLPMEMYFIFCRRQITPPRYLTENATYDLGCIMRGKKTKREVRVLDGKNWPAAQDTILNEYQLNALKEALTRELALIQGPPGTGKTYVGLSIVEILLDNANKLPIRGKPILIVCYTNHALDQFLENIASFCKENDIVRVGGGSSSEILVNIKDVHLGSRRYRKIAYDCDVDLKRCRKELKKIIAMVRHYWSEMLRLDTVILKSSDLREQMSDTHFFSLEGGRRTSNPSSHIMSSWLRASNAQLSQHLFELTRKNLIKCIISENDRRSNADDEGPQVPRDFVSRVKKYRFWLSGYLRKLHEDHEKAQKTQAEDDVTNLKNLIARAKRELLRDTEFKKSTVSEEDFKLIKTCLEEEKLKIADDNCIEQWLVGKFRTTDELLDAVESLSPVKSKSDKAVEEPKLFYNFEVEESCGNILDDDNGTEDDSRGLRKDDIRELIDNFKEVVNRDMQTLQRVKMFGIDISAAEEGDADEDDGEWQTTGKRNYRKVFGLLRKTPAFAEEEISQITDLWQLDIPKRFKLYKYWLLKQKTKIINIIKIFTDEYKTIKMKTHKVWVAKNVEILRRARVVGMTTTGAAKHREILQKVGCPIIIVEEAAEVLEAHVVTTLNTCCQHLILIGDHQQLRPNPTVYRLAKDFNMDISLFERLVKNDFPRAFLNRQHRMRPEISCFIKPIYDSLEDHESVFGYDDIGGVATNVFFLKHSQEEGTVDDNKSKANIHEAKFITALCKYFLQHGYSGEEITILAAYSGQVAAINREMGRQEASSKRSESTARTQMQHGEVEVTPHEKRRTDGLEVHKHPFSSVQVSSIDSYQGEENKIILLSLVRSNREGKVGFLKSENRLCVALSRAKEGFYAIGNFDLMESESTLWRHILKIAREKMVLGDAMKLVCINHPHHKTGVADAKDFQRKVPEGGCDRPCGFTLLCGHACPKKCHPLDSKHTFTKCQEKCSQRCDLGHICQKKFYEDCGRCTFMVKKTLQGCCHEGVVNCGDEAVQTLCKKVCQCELKCGHDCQDRCGSCAARGNHSMCSELVTKTWLPCKHTNPVKCHIDPSTDPCPEKCAANLECGHKCRGTCGECLNGRVHKPCA